MHMEELFNDTSAKIIPGQISKVETKSYPGKSLREAVLNAICHADYSIPSNIKIEFFEDRCQITHPGGIYRYNLEDIMLGIQSYRNPKLLAILYRLGYIENYGTGLERIREAYENVELKPEFKVIDRYFFLTSPNLNKDSYSFDAQNEAQNDANDAKNETQKTLEEEIIDLIKNNNSISKIEMALKTGKSKATIERLLKRSKVINHVGLKNGGHWEIVEDK